MKQPPHQKCICWTTDFKAPEKEERRLIEEGNTVTQTLVPGYCPCCGYNFNLTILNINTTAPWQDAKMGCPKCHSEGIAFQYRHAHRRMAIKCYGFLLVIAALGFVIANIIKTCS